MMYLAGRPDSGWVSLEFNVHVPMTATNAVGAALLDAPVYLAYTNGRTYLEYKFERRNGDIVEVVLVAAPDLIVETARFEPAVHEQDKVLAPALRPPVSDTRQESILRVSAHPDCLYIRYGGAEPARWVGVEPLLFGVSQKDEPVAVRAAWTQRQRELVLS